MPKSTIVTKPVVGSVWDKLTIRQRIKLLNTACPRHSMWERRELAQCTWETINCPEEQDAITTTLTQEERR